MEEVKLPKPSAWLEIDEDQIGKPYVKAAHLLATDIKGDHRRAPLYSADQMRAAILAERERCAELAKSYATCGCGGAYGRCMDNDAPLAIAAAIRKG